MKIPISTSLGGGLTSAYSTTANSLDEGMGPLNSVYTFLSSATTTIAVADPDAAVEINLVNRYIDSLSDEELASLTIELEKREQDLTSNNIGKTL